LDEAYYTSSSHRSVQNKTTNDLIRNGSTSGSNSLSSTTPILSSPFGRIGINDKMEVNSGLLHEIAQQNLDLLPMITNSNDRSMELFREIMINGDNGERDFKEMVEEFVQLIENKLSNTEIKMFDAK